MQETDLSPRQWYGFGAAPSAAPKKQWKEKNLEKDQENGGRSSEMV
jgi:hypothetical protein